MSVSGLPVTSTYNGSLGYLVRYDTTNQVWIVNNHGTEVPFCAKHLKVTSNVPRPGYFPQVGMCLRAAGYRPDYTGGKNAQEK